MTKIGTITFHWSENYGAVLQAYALQKFLQSIGADTEIIDYVPRRTLMVQSLDALRRGNCRLFKKRRLFRSFRKRELCLSKRTYHTNRELHSHCRGYDKIICGSDQIWNESFCTGAEGKPTLSYFLDFAGDEVGKIAYAASFGTESLKESTKERIKPFLSRFSHISARENSGKRILEELGVNAQTVLDPTLVLPRAAYEELLNGKTFANNQPVFSYVLHHGQSLAQKIVHCVQRSFHQEEKDASQLYIGVYEWLYRLCKSEFVVTNSFHGVVMSLIFHRPFVAIPVERSGMNDRILTLLTNLGLEDRIVSSTEGLDELIHKDIPWETVDERLEQMRRSSEDFLLKAVRA